MTSQPNHSTLSVQSTTTVSSTTPLRQPQNPPKDYEAALGVLQSRYGTGPSLPNPKKEASKKLPGSSQTTPAATPQLTPVSSQTTLTTSSSISESSGGSSSNSNNSGGRRSKDKKSILKSLFKGKGKEKEEKAKDS